MPKVVRVSTEDNHFQRAEVLKRNREKRTKYHQCFVEGVQAINFALQHGWHFDSLLYSGTRKLSRWASDVMERAGATTHLDLSERLLAKLSDKEETSELLAIIRVPDATSVNIPARTEGLVVVFDRPTSPGNLGSSIRSAVAFGVDGVGGIL